MSFRRAGQSSSTDKNADKDAAFFLWCNEISLNNDVCDAHTTRKKRMCSRPKLLSTAVSIFIFIYYPLTLSAVCISCTLKKCLGIISWFLLFYIAKTKTLFLASPQESARPQQTYICEPQENRMEEVQRRLLISI